MTSLPVPHLPTSQIHDLLKQPTKDPKAILKAYKACVQAMNAQTTRETIQTLADCSAFKELGALRLFLHRRKLYTYDLYRHELSNLSRMKQLELAVSLFFWREKELGDEVRREELVQIIAMHHKAAIADVFNIFHHLCRQGMRHVLGTAGFNALLAVVTNRAPSASGDGQIKSILAEMSRKAGARPIRPNMETYELLVSGFQSVESSKQFYERAQAEGYSSPTLTERFIQKLFSSGMPEEAIQIYQAVLAMRNRRLISHGTLASVLRYCTSNGDLEGTHGVFNDALSLGIKPTTEMFAMLIDLCAAVKDVDTAHAFLSTDLPRYGLEMDENIYNSLIALYSSVGDLVRAESVLQEMRLRGCREQYQTLAPYISACLHASNTNSDESLHKRALELWKVLLERDCKVSAQLLAEVCAWFRDSPSVSKFISRAPELLDKRENLATFFAAFCKIDNVATSRQAFVFRRLSRNSEFLIDTSHFDHLIQQFALKEQWELCLNAAFEMTDLCLYLRFNHPEPSALKFTSKTVLHRSKHAHPFILGDANANSFVLNVVLPNNLECPDSLLLGDPAAFWDEARLLLWKEQLFKWHASLVRQGTI